MCAEIRNFSQTIILCVFLMPVFSNARIAVCGGMCLPTL